MHVQNFENLWIDENDYYRDSRNWFICYTDGSCKGNHQHGRRYSGSGIVFGDHPRREISQPGLGNLTCHTTCRQTCNLFDRQPVHLFG
ncbi:unnamed protein product [Oikopleura dioica]|uniref:RNase H type-1 domain-containing protein n=1 Tax=Oikopleura dioica TaxID=34765 RepID=E4XCQ7_OIKDI|nr:unnamed protein product [Oikopleura dioica]